MAEEPGFRGTGWCQDHWWPDRRESHLQTERGSGARGEGSICLWLCERSSAKEAYLHKVAPSDWKKKKLMPTRMRLIVCMCVHSFIHTSCGLKWLITISKHFTVFNKYLSGTATHEHFLSINTTTARQNAEESGRQLEYSYCTHELRTHLKVELWILNSTSAKVRNYLH